MNDRDVTTDVKFAAGRHWIRWRGRWIPTPAGGNGESGGAGDGGSGEGGAGEGGGGDSGGAGSDGGSGASGQDGDGDDEGQGEGETFTQAQLDEILSKRLGREKAKWEREVKEAAERAKMDEAERAKAEKADAEKAAADAKAAATAARVEAAAVRAAIKAGIDPDRVDRFLKVADLDPTELASDDGPDAKAITKAVDKAVGEWPEFKTATGGRRSGGDLNGGSDSPPKTLEDAVAARLGATA